MIATDPSRTFSNQEILNKLNILLLNRIDELLCALNIRLYAGYGRYTGVCPLHAGADGPTAFSICAEGEYAGSVHCWSHGCMNIFKPTLIGLVRGKISKDVYGWKSPGDKIAPFGKTIHWIENFLGLRSDELEFTFVESAVKPAAPTFNPLLGYPRDKVIRSLKIPCPFYSKKFDPKILTRYDIGLSENPLQKFYWRTCVPIYDETNKSLVGITGRSNWEQCSHCKLYHDSVKRCPDPKYSIKYVKWRHSAGMRTAYHLFNFWREFPLIESKRRIILVESVGNALKLIQNGARNVCATFGAKLSHDQTNLLNRAKVTKILVLFDNDPAGHKGAERIIKDFGNFYDIKALFPCPEGTDIADLKDSYIQNYIFPEIRNAAKS